MTHASITGVGSYLPERRLTNADLEAMVETSDEWIATRTGIRERRIAAEDEPTSVLAAKAAEAALRDAGLNARDVDVIIVGTSSPDHIFPSSAALVQDLIGADCAAYDVLAACSGFVYALQQASSAIESGRARRALVIGADAVSRFTDWTDRSTCVLFADGAGAVVLEASDEPGVMGIDLGADGSGADVLTIPAGGSAIPSTVARIEAGDQFIHMVGGEVFKFAVRIIPETTRRALAASGLGIEDLTWLVPHQANERIMTAAAERLGIERERVFSNIATTGNTSAASIPLALADLYTDGRLAPGDIVAFVGFGGGLTWGAAIVRWTKEKTR